MGLGPDNFERGDKALHAVAFYMGGSRLPDVNADEVLELGDHAITVEVGGCSATLPQGSPINYLIADLCHLLRRYDFGIDHALDHAVAHFASDVIEQAWEHSDDWDNCLQDASNVERALEVMRAAGVPERVHEQALIYTGLRQRTEES